MIAMECATSVAYGSEPVAVMHPGGNRFGVMQTDRLHHQGGSVAER